MTSLSIEEVRHAVQSALAEDVGPGDVTTLATVPETAACRAHMVAREKLVVAGLPLAAAAFRELAPAAMNSKKPPRTARASNPVTR